MKINLLHSHGSPTSYLYAKENCRCGCCRAAYRDYFRAYRAIHRDRLSEDAKRRRHENPEKKHEQDRKARERGGERLKDYLRRYGEANRERLRGLANERAHSSEYRRKHREYIRGHLDQRHETCRRWRLQNPEQGRVDTLRRRARKLAAGGTHTASDIKSQYRRQKGRCYWGSRVNPECTQTLTRGYHVDHVIPLAAGGSNGPENLVLACPSCNQRKGAKHPMDFAGVLF